MKIVDFKEFVEYPAGTIFSYYDPCIFRGLFRKEETLCVDGEATDYFEQCLLPSCSFPEEKITVGGVGRWGEYWDEQQYGIYEQEDLDILKKLLGV